MRDFISEYGTGFKKRQLERARQFYVEYPKVNALRSQFNWTQYKLPIRHVAESRKEDNA